MVLFNKIKNTHIQFTKYSYEGFSLLTWCHSSSQAYQWLKMMSDASDMLAAALEQMDGIIAGKFSYRIVNLMHRADVIAWSFMFVKGGLSYYSLLI